MSERVERIRMLLEKAKQAKAALEAAKLPPESARLYCAEGHCVWVGPKSEANAHIHTECPMCGDAWWDQDEEDRVLDIHPFQNSPVEFNAEATARMELERAFVEAAPALLKCADLLRSIRDNFDCDEDAHRYNTECRKCAAEEALRELEREGES